MTGAANSPSERSIRKFNPGTFQSDEEVIEQFVVRGSELGIVLDVLRGNIDSPSCQHVLVVAPRGRGKTMLLARVAAELRTASTLSERLLPVRFMEESHEVFNLADFWLETLFHLARETAAHDPEIAQDLHETRAALVGRWNEQGLDEHARAAALAAADRLGRRLVLMVENMQALCRNVDDDFGWKLRQVLQSEPQIMLLASAASRFKGLDDAEQPFFELFRIVDLEPLTTGECRCLWRAVSGDAVTDREIRPLEILTGGSPRLLVIVAGFARHRSLRQLMEELVTLIDEHTEYFRGHLEVLGKAERRVYLAVIDLWQPSRPGEIAARARMDLRVVSTMLGRLVNRGAVIAAGNGKKRLYSAAERLYSIYYKLRRERDEAAVVRNLIHFMAVFYSEAELSELSGRLVSEAAASAAIRAGIKQALGEIRPPDGPRASTARALEQIASQAAENNRREIARRVKAAAREQAFESVIEIADEALGGPGAGASRLPAAFAAYLLHQKATAYQEMDKWNAAIAACDEIVARFSNSNEPRLRWWVAVALFDGGRGREESGQWDAAISAYDEVAARFGDSDEPKLQWWVAAALVDKGTVHAKCGKWEAAIAAYEEVLSEYGDSDEPNVQSSVAFALLGKGKANEMLGEWKAAIAVCDEVVTRFGHSTGSILQWTVAHALADKGTRQAELGSADDALESADALAQKLAALSTEDEGGRLRWRMQCVRARALSLRRAYEPALEVFRSAYAAFQPGDKVMMHGMMRLVPDLVATGAATGELVAILLSDGAKAATLTPLVVALREFAGEHVRAPEEVRKVAADVRKRLVGKLAAAGEGPTMD